MAEALGHEKSQFSAIFHYPIMGLRQNTSPIDFYFALCKLYYSNTPALTFIVKNIFHYIGFFFAQNGGCISKENKTTIRQKKTFTLTKTEHIQK